MLISYQKAECGRNLIIYKDMDNSYSCPHTALVNPREIYVIHTIVPALPFMFRLQYLLFILQGQRCFGLRHCPQLFLKNNPVPQAVRRPFPIQLHQQAKSTYFSQICSMFEPVEQF